MMSLDAKFAARGPIGGVGHIVEIDESKIGHRKAHAGRIVEGQWVIGMIDRDTKEIRIEICPNNLRNAQTLLPIIENHVLPGTTIITDEWRAYNNLPQLGFPHQTVNHTLHFVDPVTHAHTQNIESSWRAMKHKICRGGGSSG